MRSNVELEGEDINLELEKQGRWMNRKLWLIDETNKKLKEIREENVDQILNQNTKLIEECNIIRAENERYKKLTRNVQKMLMEAKRMKTKKTKKPNIEVGFCNYRNWWRSTRRTPFSSKTSLPNSTTSSPALMIS